MNYIDFIVIILLILSLIGGLSKGFIYEFASLFGLIVGVWGAIKFSGATRDFLEHYLNIQNNHVQIIAFIITFLAIIILVHLLAKLIEKAVESINIGVVNRIFGGLLAVLKSAFIIGVIFILIQRINDTFPSFPEKAIEESRFYEPMRNVAIYSFPFLKGIYEDIKGPENSDNKESNKTT